MKIKHKISNQIIDVPTEHAQMLMGQGWEQYKEDKQNGLQEQKIEQGQKAHEKVKPGRKPK